jgi:hypothetical protein
MYSDTEVLSVPFFSPPLYSHLYCSSRASGVKPAVWDEGQDGIDESAVKPYNVTHNLTIFLAYFRK